jgi:uncharacterized membrane protein YcgQ (UPF0703/DUF1980 family)
MLKPVMRYYSIKFIVYRIYFFVYIVAILIKLLVQLEIFKKVNENLSTDHLDRRHRMIELKMRADTATLPVS